jgi:hypothetical protein
LPFGKMQCWGMYSLLNLYDINMLNLCRVIK